MVGSQAIWTNPWTGRPMQAIRAAAMRRFGRRRRQLAKRGHGAI
jgi:hypothetical protein